MKQVFTTLCSLVLIVLSTPFTQVQATALTQEKRVIVTFKKTTDKQFIQKSKGRLHREFKNTTAAAITIPASELAMLKKNPAVEYVEEDIIINASEQIQDYGIINTHSPVAWKSGYAGKGIKIAVVDTGISSHEDLTIAGGVSTVSYINSFTDDNGHGTHVAGIIGARNNNIGMVGIAPEADLYAVKALDGSGAGYLSDIIAGIEWCITNKMDVINLSLGTETDSLALRTVVDKAYYNGILVVAAAGNDASSNGAGDTVDYPARYSSVIATAAVDPNNNRAPFSSTGPLVEVAAPGVSVYSTYLNNQYATMSGTSMAAPFTAGNLALLKQANPTLSAAQLREKLQQSVRDIGASGKDEWYGHGLIQAPSVSATSTPAPVAPAPAPPAAKPPVVTPQNTTTLVRTDKSTYYRGRASTITTVVKAANGRSIGNAKVTLSITSPSGSVSTLSGTTNRTGVLRIQFPTKTKSPRGRYKIIATSTATNYKRSSGTAFFTLR